MNDIEHQYIMLKLVSGETILCTLVQDNDDYFTILFPIEMKSYKADISTTRKEYYAGTAWCPFTDDDIFQIYKQDVIVLKSLNESTIAYYRKFIDNEQSLDLSNAIVIKGTNTIN